jgi:hypothetical protein
VILLALAKETSTTRWHRWWSAGCIGLMLLVCSAATWLSQHPELPPGLSILLIHGALLILLLASLGGLVLCRVYGWGKWPTLVGIIAMVLLLPFPLELMGRDIRQMHSAAQLRDKVGTVPSEVECLAWQFAEPSLVFHFDRPWKYTSKMETVAKHMARKNPTITVLLRREWTLAQALNNPQPARDFSKEVDAIVAAPGRLLEFSITAVTEGIDALGEVSVMVGWDRAAEQTVETAAERSERLNPQHDEQVARVFHGRGADTDILVASVKAYLAALTKLTNALSGAQASAAE